MSNNVNNSISNYIVNTATKVSKNISGNNTIITGIINSSDTSGYKVSLYGGADPVTAAALGTETYSQNDNVYLWMVGSKGGDTHQDFTYYIIGKVNTGTPAEKMSLRDFFEPNVDDEKIDVGNFETDKIWSTMNDRIPKLLKKYSAFKLSLKVTLSSGEEIKNPYLRIFFKNGDGVILGKPLEFSLGDCVGNLLSSGFSSIVQEKIFFIGKEYKDFTVMSIKSSLNGATFSGVTITPGIISANAQDYSAIIKSYTSSDPTSATRDYVLGDTDSVWLKANVLFKARDLFATGIQYYWQVYNNDISSWGELNGSNSLEILLEDSTGINSIQVIEADDNSFELKGVNLPSYRNRVRCVAYYGAIEIISNELIVFNYDHIELKAYKKDRPDVVSWIVESETFTNENNYFKVELENSLKSLKNYFWKIGGFTLQETNVQNGEKIYYIQVNETDRCIIEVEKYSDTDFIKAVYLPFLPFLFQNNNNTTSIQIIAKTTEGEEEILEEIVLTNEIPPDEYLINIIINEEDHKIFSYYTGVLEILKNGSAYTESITFLTSDNKSSELETSYQNLVMEFEKNNNMKYYIISDDNSDFELGGNENNSFKDLSSSNGKFKFKIEEESITYKTEFEQKLNLYKKDYFKHLEENPIKQESFKDIKRPLTTYDANFDRIVWTLTQEVSEDFEINLQIKFLDKYTGIDKNIKYIIFGEPNTSSLESSLLNVFKIIPSDYFDYYYYDANNEEKKLEKGTILENSVTGFIKLRLVPPEATKVDKDELFYFYDFLNRNLEDTESFLTVKTAFAIIAAQGAPGRGVSSTDINEDGKLVITYDDGQIDTPGVVVGSAGRGINTIVYNSTTGSLDFNLTDGTTQTVTIEGIGGTGPYDIYFDANGGKWSDEEGSIKSFKTASNGFLFSTDLNSIPSTSPQTEGENHAFGCWADKIELSNDQIENWATQITTSTQFITNSTIYAKWAPHTIAFDPRGGVFSNLSIEGRIYEKTNLEGKIDSLPTCNKTIDYTFYRWASKTKWGDEVDSNTSFKKNSVVYAQWKGEYSINLDANGGLFEDGSSSKLYSTDSNGLLSTVEVPKYEGYVLEKWYDRAENFSLTKKELAEAVFTENTNLIAIWNKDSSGGAEAFSVTFGTSELEKLDGNLMFYTKASEENINILVTLTIEDGTPEDSNIPKYNTRDSTLRLYSGDTLTVAVSLGSFTTVTIECLSEKFANLELEGETNGHFELDQKTYTYTWTGDSFDITFKATASTRITKIIVSR